MEREKTPLLFLVGPTGVGKTKLSLRLAKRFNAEILSLDSMQVYRGMDIGTAKASPEERAEVPHHLIDIRRPDRRFTVREYQEEAYRAIEDVRSRGRLPFFVGGTGLYLDAILKDFRFAEFDCDPALRERLNEEYRHDGGESLYARLKEVDPETAKSLTPSDRKKIIRALEVYGMTGEPISAHKNQENRSPKWKALVLVLADEREILYDRINRRVDQMLEDGVVEENIRLLRDGISPKSQAMEAIGYKEVQWYLRGLLTEQEMAELLKRNSRRYAKRQLTWYRRDPEAVWIMRNDRTEEEIAREAEAIVRGYFREEFANGQLEEREND